MAANLVYTCDVCGTRKGAANHWHALTVAKESMTLWKWYNSHQPGALHLCSERCVMLAISARLGRASFAADAPPVVEVGPLDDEPVVTEISAVSA
mgnify:CR=1 FL=1